MLASRKIWLSEALSFRIGQRVLQLGNFQCTMQGRRCHFNDFSNVRQNEIREMHYEFPSCGNKTTCCNGMCWRYFKVSLSLHVFRFCERILQLGDIHCTVQGRWCGYDDQSQIWTHEVWKMHQENSGCRYQEDNWHRMRRRYYKVSFSIQIISENSATGRHSQQNADQVRWYWWRAQNMDEWSLENAYGDSWTWTLRNQRKSVVQKIL